MRWLFLSTMLPAWLFAQTYGELLSLLESSYRYQSAQALENASEALYQAAKGKNLPSLDATLSAIEWNDTPTMTLNMPPLVSGITTAPVGTRRHLEGSLVLTYPLFSGFAISATIDKAKLESEQASLKRFNLKRNLALQTTALYSAVIAETKAIVALKSSENAIEKAYLKAKGYYENGLLAQSELFAIEAKKYDIHAQLIDRQNLREQYLNQLGTLLNTKIVTLDDETSLEMHAPSENEALTFALEEREDMKAMQKSVDVAHKSIELAQSKYYPNVALVGAIKHQGDSLALNGDGYTNADKSYAGMSISWNLFNGMSDRQTLEAARATQMSASFELAAYKSEIQTEIQNGFLEFHTLEAKLQSAKEELRASDTYTALSQGRFDNQLISADELSRAIASRAAVEAKVASLESQLFNQKARLWLFCGWSVFETKVLPHL